MFNLQLLVIISTQRIQVMERAVLSSLQKTAASAIKCLSTKVSQELGLQFIDVKMQDTATYRKYRKDTESVS